MVTAGELHCYILDARFFFVAIERLASDAIMKKSPIWATCPTLKLCCWRHIVNKVHILTHLGYRNLSLIALMMFIHKLLQLDIRERSEWYR